MRVVVESDIRNTIDGAAADLGIGEQVDAS